uniref:Uncharacterized protein n=1 Tax=Octopus bimaculoides TaxID=37653 RepID=A0A0L8GK60_OCTBM
MLFLHLQFGTALNWPCSLWGSLRLGYLPFLVTSALTPIHTALQKVVISLACFLALSSV